MYERDRKDVVSMSSSGSRVLSLSHDFCVKYGVLNYFSFVHIDDKDNKSTTIDDDKVKY